MTPAELVALAQAFDSVVKAGPLAVALVLVSIVIVALFRGHLRLGRELQAKDEEITRLRTELVTAQNDRDGWIERCIELMSTTGQAVDVTDKAIKMVKSRPSRRGAPP